MSVKFFWSKKQRKVVIDVANSLLKTFYRIIVAPSFLELCVAMGSFYSRGLQEVHFRVRKDKELEIDLLLTILMVDNTARNGTIKFRGVARDGSNWSGECDFFSGVYGSIEKI